MSSPPPQGIRAEARARTLERIEEIADAQLREGGIPGLSLRAISRELGMAPSAIYRYFESSDALLTHLIIKGFDDISDVVAAAVDARADDTPRVRLQTLARATREFFVENPHIFALLYGTPIPGYQAPQDTVAPASRVGELMLALIVESRSSTPKAPKVEASTGLIDGIAPLRASMPDADPHVLAVGIAAWNQLYGLISFELFGHFVNAVGDYAEYFDAAMDMWWDRLLGKE